MLSVTRVGALLLVSSDLAAPRTLQAHQLYCSMPRWDLTLESIAVDGVGAEDVSSEGSVWNESGKLRWDGRRVWLLEVSAVYGYLASGPEGE